MLHGLIRARAEQDARAVGRPACDLAALAQVGQPPGRASTTTGINDENLGRAVRIVLIRWGRICKMNAVGREARVAAASMGCEACTDGGTHGGIRYLVRKHGRQGGKPYVALRDEGELLAVQRRMTRVAFRRVAGQRATVWHDACMRDDEDNQILRHRSFGRLGMVEHV